MSAQKDLIADLNRLPTDLQDSLVALQEPAEDRFVFLREPSYLVLLPVVALIGWIVYVWSASQQPLWEDWMYWLIGGISLFIFPAAIWSGFRFLIPRMSKLKNGYTFTPNEYFRVNGRQIECHSLRDIMALRTKPDSKEIELWIETEETRIKVDDLSTAQKLENTFDRWKAKAVDEVGPKLRAPSFAYQRSRGLAAAAAILDAGSLFGAGFTFAAGRMNVRYDDDTTWATATAADTIDYYEIYQARYPTGIHATEATDAISGHIGKLKDNYLSRVHKGAAPDGVAKLAAIYERVGERPDRTIYIRVSEVRQIDPAAIDNIKKKYFVDAQPYDYTVPPSGEAFRRQKLASDLKILLSGNSPRGAIKYQITDNPPADAPSVDVTLTIKSVEQFYRITSFADGRYRSSIYPTASFTIHFTLRTFSEDTGYSSEYFEQPMGVSSGAFDKRDKENYTFDKVLFSTVMEGFDATFTKMFGFAESTIE